MRGVAAAPVYLGVDVGGTKVAVASISGHECQHLTERPTVLDSTEALLDGIESVVQEVADQTGAPTAVGVGVPSQIEFSTGRVMASVNIPLAGVPLRQELERRFGCPVFVDNDANCAALAETLLVENPPCRYLVMLTLGTGVGGGIVVDGQIFRGADGLGAELGHVVISPDGPSCPGRCPNRGCIEAMCSGTALEREATDFGRDWPESPLGRIALEEGKVRGRDVVAAAREGDEGSLGLLQRLGTWLGVGIASFVNAFQPEYLVVGGGLSAASDLFLEHARREAGSRALPALWERTRITVARGGPAAGVIGAGMLALQEHSRSEDTARSTVGEGST